MNKRSMRILGFNEIRDMLVREAPSRLSKELARNIKPYSDENEIARALNDTEEALTCLEREGAVPLGGSGDIRPLLEKAKREVPLDGAECLVLRENVRRYDEIKDFFETKYGDYVQLSEKAREIGDFTQLERRFSGVFDEENRIRDNASAELLRLRGRIAELERRTKRYINTILANKEYQKYFQDTIVTVRNNRSVIPVKQEYRHAFPGIVHDMSASGATLYIEPMALVDANNDLQAARLSETKEVECIFRRLTALVAENYNDLMTSTAAVAHLEFAFAKARLAIRMKAQRPMLSTKRAVKLYGARHPLIPADAVVANTILLGGEYRILLITGSNTGGKTVAMKTLGLLVLMYQSGLFIPVRDGSELPVFGDIFADIGDEQDIAQNLSTFSGHMKQLIYTIMHSTANDLILADEIGSGTDPAEGCALAIAIMEEICKKGAFAMVTTHYNDLKNYAYNTPGVENGHVEFDTETLRPTYKLRIGSAGSSHAFNISERLGMPAPILEKARNLRSRAQDVDIEAVLTKLNDRERQLDEERTELERLLAEAKSHEEWLRREKEKAAAKRQDIIASSRREAADLKRELRLEAERIIRDLKHLSREATEREKSRAIDRARREIQQISLPDVTGENRIPVNSKTLKPGDTVYINSLGALGKVEEIKGKRLTVSARGMTIRVGLAELSAPYPEEVKKERQAEKRAAAASTFRPVRTGRVATEINIIGKTGNEALPEVSRFLDQALAAGFSPVRIIHGKGSGALRKQVHEYLAAQPFVKAYAPDDAQSGGDGVTVVHF